jgi:putative FmdB family regulatory protein
MPTYEYRCRACGHGFDIVQSFKDESLTICPACGGELRKVFSAPAISFKGSGFYANDSRVAEKSSGSTADASKDSRDSRDSKDSRDTRDSKDSRERSKDSKDGSKDSRDSRERSKDSKDGPGGGEGPPKPAERKGESTPPTTKKETPST